MARTWVDPVCGMPVDSPDALRTVVNTVEYRFCSVMCLNAFKERPGRYLKGGNGPRFDRTRKGGKDEPGRNTS
ncbi:MAG: YHS domain-containing protein [Acidobacteria bacterium]|nr:YHS domain-containing protein [Acidobacteriota bacterium]